MPPYAALPPTPQQGSLAIHYMAWGDARSTEPMLLVHELGGTVDSLRPLAESVARVHRVIAYDQRGAGLSEKPGTAFTLDDLAGDIHRVADALSVPRPFHLMGLAMGALTALRFAIAHGDELASLILCDATHEVNEGARGYLSKQAAAVRTHGMRHVAARTCKAALQAGAGTGADAGSIEYEQRFLGNSPDSYARYLEALAGFEVTADDLAAIGCPTLCITGEHDAIWPVANGRALAAMVPGSTFEVLPGAGHLPPVQHAEAVARRVVRFTSDHVRSVVSG